MSNVEVGWVFLMTEVCLEYGIQSSLLSQVYNTPYCGKFKNTFAVTCLLSESTVEITNS